MFADDIVVCSDRLKQMEEKLERYRYVQQRREMKVSGSKTEYMCESERGEGATVKI